MEKADALGLSTAAILLDLLFGAVPAFDQICSRSFGGAERRRVAFRGHCGLAPPNAPVRQPQAIGLVEQLPLGKASHLNANV